MSLLSMPFLVLNFGGEMIYILEQRLHAQNIPKDKCNKVLQDVTRAMFSPKFISELLKPQPIYSPTATREIFDRLAHSSIMRLSESSMDKLFDLMTMGFKYQLVSCTHPRDLVDVTLNHLDSIRNAVEGSEATAQQVDAAISTMIKLCKELSNSEFAQIRQTLTTFFQDKRIKVSLFLQDGLQSPDGTILLPKGGPIPNDTTVEYPGKIRYFDDSSVVEDTFNFPLSNVTTDRVDGDTYDPKTRECKLGKNLYTVDRSKKKEASKPAAKPQPTTASTTTSSQKLKESGVTASAAAELKALRDMIGSNNPGSDFKINLFPEAPDEPGKTNREICINKVSREDMERINQELVGVIGSLDIGGGNTDDKDILDLMDEACN